MPRPCLPAACSDRKRTVRSFCQLTRFQCAINVGEYFVAYGRPQAAKIFHIKLEDGRFFLENVTSYLPGSGPRAAFPEVVGQEQ